MKNKYVGDTNTFCIQNVLYERGWSTFKSISGSIIDFENCLKISEWSLLLQVLFILIMIFDVYYIF